MEYIVTDEKSLKESAEALGFGIIKKPKMLKIKPCSECGVRHNRTEQFTKEEYIPTGRDKAPRARLIRYKTVKFYCNTCGKSVEKGFAVGRRQFHISADQENEIRQMWNDIN